MVLFIMTLTVPMFSASIVIQFQDILIDALTTYCFQSLNPLRNINVRGM